MHFVHIYESLIFLLFRKLVNKTGDSKECSLKKRMAPKLMNADYRCCLVFKKKKTTAVCCVPNAICANAKERNSTKKKGGRVVARLFLNVRSTPVRAHKHIGR